MERRNIFKAALAGVAGALIASKASAATGVPDIAKVVYHVDDLDKVRMSFNNIGNHYEGMGGRDKVNIALVILGPAMKAIVADKAEADVLARLAKLSAGGLELWACINTMQSMKLQLSDLAPGFKVADKGGVVKVAELQSLGYCYLRP